MSFTYFAYGSNLWTPQMRSRCPSATPIGTARLLDWTICYNKPSVDGSAKLNVVPAEHYPVDGVLYEIADEDHKALDAAEPGYDRIAVSVVAADGSTVEALTYQWTGPPTSTLPYDWYVETAKAGARQNGLEPTSWEHPSTPDPLAPGLRPATEDDLGLIRSILSDAISADSPRFSVHPGDMFWWMYHSDPRHPDQDALWIQGEDALLNIERTEPEIGTFARPGHSTIGLIEWAQRRLGGRGVVGFVDDADTATKEHLKGIGLEPENANALYEWDLANTSIPDPVLGDGWTLRHVEGESEANNRRLASHAAFKSKMDHDMHLDRYLRFMRSPVYERERDLVAVAPDGRIASFIYWWSDESGIVEIEPFGTHPDFQGQGTGRALMYFALQRMAEAGMTTARVATDDWRADANDFYDGIGFERKGSVRWWVPGSGSLESEDAGSD